MKIGDIYQEEIRITAETIKKFAEFSGDFNPVHFDDEAARAQGFKGRIAHGMCQHLFFLKFSQILFQGQAPST